MIRTIFPAMLLGLSVQAIAIDTYKVSAKLSATAAIGDNNLILSILDA